MIYADLTVPKSLVIPGKPSEVWWNDECSDAVLATEKALDQALRSYKPVDYVEIEKKCAEARRFMKREKSILELILFHN